MFEYVVYPISVYMIYVVSMRFLYPENKFTQVGGTIQDLPNPTVETKTYTNMPSKCNNMYTQRYNKCNRHDYKLGIINGTKEDHN